jgi:DNA processing protein
MSRPPACVACLRRAWLLAAINDHMVHADHRLEQLVDVLALDDGDLIAALGGARKEQLRARYERWDPASMAPPPEGVVRVCRHGPQFPARLAHGHGAPRLLHVAGGTEHLATMLSAPVVAIVGTRTASDYGMEVAHGLARGLAAAGVCVLSGLADGIAAAAHTGALQVGGPTLTVLAGGLDVPYPAGNRTLHKRIQQQGCALAEQPHGAPAHSWNQTARARIVVALAALVVLVEAQDTARELLYARLALSTGRRLAAVPGRVTAPAAQGPNRLLRGGGAQLVRNTEDALDVLYGVGPRERQRRRRQRDGERAEAQGAVGTCAQAHPQHVATRVHRGTAPQGSARNGGRRVRGEHPAAGDARRAGTRAAPTPCEPTPREPALQAVLDAVGDGRDTLEALLTAGTPEQDTVLALARLELAGQLVRGDAGRYVRRL